jgi:hypothetical protein
MFLTEAAGTMSVQEGKFSLGTGCLHSPGMARGDLRVEKSSYLYSPLTSSSYSIGLEDVYDTTLEF